MDASDLLTVVLVVLGVITLIGIGVIVFVMRRYQIPPRGLVAMIGALVYMASPIDVLPEVILGPIGLLDDAGAATAAAVFVYKIVQVKKRLEKAGVSRRRRPDQLDGPRPERLAGTAGDYLRRTAEESGTPPDH